MPPIPIRDADELRKIGQDPAFPRHGDFQLTQDIALPEPWMPLPAVEDIILDGNGFCIGPLTAPLFERVDYSSVFDLALDAHIEATTTDGTGALMARGTNNALSDCIVRGRLQGEGPLGGLAGELSACVVEGCIGEAELTGTGATGGLVGIAQTTRIVKCEHYGCIRATEGEAGGMAARLEGGAVVDCINEGTVRGGSCVGGFAGIAIAQGETQLNENECRGKEAVVGTGDYVGGIVGAARGDVEIRGNRVCTRVVCEGEMAGGIVGGVLDDPEGSPRITDNQVEICLPWEQDVPGVGCVPQQGQRMSDGEMDRVLREAVASLVLPAET